MRKREIAHLVKSEVDSTYKVEPTYIVCLGVTLEDCVFITNSFYFSRLFSIFTN